MSHATDEVLRRAVRELAGEARTANNLAPLAMARGRRVRRRRRIVNVAAAVVAFAVIAAPFVWLRPGSGPQPAGPPIFVPPPSNLPTAYPSSTSSNPAVGVAWWNSPLAVTDGWVMTGATTTGTPREPAYVLDRDRNAYVAYDTYDELWAAPRGNLAAVYDYNRPGETGLMNVATTEVTWVRTGNHILDPQWSPDGGRLLLTVMSKQPDAGLSAVILTAANRKVREFPVDTTKYLCTDYCQFTWMPDGKEVALQQTDPGPERTESARHARRGLQLFSADTGRATRLVPVKGDVVGPYSWSPDGKLVVIQGQQEAQLADAATGTVLRKLPSADAFWTAKDRLVYLGASSGNLVATEIDVAGNELLHIPLPAELGRRRISVAPR